MKNVAGVLTALALCALPSGAHAVPALPDAVDAAAAEFMAKQHVPGVAIAVVKHGMVAYERGYGYADVRGKVPVTVDTRFEIGSITKQFTATCIIQQVRAGKLSLDDPMSKFFTDYPAGAKVTVRQMLSHTSGVPEYLRYGDLTHPMAFADILGRVATKPLDFVPGSRWAYSNTNYVLLGRILELTAQEPYEQYVRKHIFEPAHMTQSGFMSEERTLPDMATGYAKTDAGGVVPAKPAFGGADGAIVSTLGDIAKWNAALANGTIVDRADVKLMQTPATLNDSSPTRYGFGWAIDALAGHPRISHEGGSEGFAASSAVFPNDDESIIVLDNLAPTAPNRVASAIFSALHPDVTAKFDTVAPGEDKAVTARLREVLRRAAIGQLDSAQFSRHFLAELDNPGGRGFVKQELGPLGPVTKMVFRGKARAQKVTSYDYDVAFGSDREFVNIEIDADNKIAAFAFFSSERPSGSVARASLTRAGEEDTAVTARVRDWLRRLASGDIDRSQLAASFSPFYTPQMVAREKKDFGPLGAPKAVVFRGQTERGGITMSTYDVRFASARRTVLIGIDADGKIALFASGMFLRQRAARGSQPAG